MNSEFVRYAAYRLRPSTISASVSVESTWTKYRDIVREIALDQYGYVTTKQAVEAGVPAVELPKLAERGGLENVAYGIYRVPDAPATPFAQFAEALLRAGNGSYLHGDSVLALFGLADVIPRRIRVAVRKRTRPKLPPFIELTLVKGDVVTTRFASKVSSRNALPTRSSSAGGASSGAA